MAKARRASDGLYHINGRTFKKLEGSRAEVFHGTAFKTSGGLLAKDLVQNKRGRIVSKKKFETAKREKRLEHYGYFAEDGRFGAVKRTPRGSPSRRSPSRRSHSRRRAHTVGGRTRRRR